MGGVDMMADEELTDYFDKLDRESQRLGIPMITSPDDSTGKGCDYNFGIIEGPNGKMVVDPDIAKRMRHTRDLGDEVIRDIANGKIG